jgi:hypothetical protein
MKGDIVVHDRSPDYRVTFLDRDIPRQEVESLSGGRVTGGAGLHVPYRRATGTQFAPGARSGDD